MNKNIIAAAVLTLVSGLAAAQSNVTIYGNVDIGVQSQNNAGAGPATTVANGGISPSVWGFRGTEDLGNGLKATFNLEGHFKPDTGAMESGVRAGGGTNLFRRQSNIGLSSAGLGTVTLGNQFSPAVLAFAATDPRGLRENFSGLYSWAFNSGVVSDRLANNGNNDLGVFLQNAISYSNTIGPVGFAGGYSLSEKNGSVTALGLTYTGPVSLSAAYQSTNIPGTTDKLSKMYSVGAAYSMDAFTGKVNYLRGETNNIAANGDTKVNVFGAGVDWKVAANNTVIVAAYFGKDKNHSTDKTTTLVLADEYALSKRTVVYGQLAFANAKSGATLQTAITGISVAGENTRVINVGVKHSF